MHDSTQPTPRWPGTRSLLMALAGYFVALIAATYPALLSPTTRIPGHPTDPLVHLWTMRNTQAGMGGDRSPYFSDGLNYPTGLPLGFNPTMHLQTVGFMALSAFTDNDILRFNILWTFGFLSTGIGAFLLGFRVSRSRCAAWLAGLATMLSGPMMLHAHGHVELIQMGAVSLFLMAWIDFIERPKVGRMLVAGVFYLAMVFSCPYLAVLGLIPATWYLAWATWQQVRSQRLGWLRLRLRWSLALSALLVGPLALAFAGQVWAVSAGYSMQRPRTAFDRFGAAAWSYAVPTPEHGLGKILLNLGGTFFDDRVYECGSYLGLVSIGLLLVAARSSGRSRLPNAGFWWSVLGLMFVLSLGSRLDVFGLNVPLPAGWLWTLLPPMRLLRVPARFNLLVAVAAAAPVAIGARMLLEHLDLRRRLAATLVLAVLIVVDLSMVFFPTAAIPDVPDYYRTLAGREGSRSLIDAPLFDSSEGLPQSSLWGYWQSKHGICSTAGYSAHPNRAFDAAIIHPSPFWSERNRAGAEHPESSADLRDEVWLYLTIHSFDHVVLHRAEPFELAIPMEFGPLERALASAEIHRDSAVTIWSREKLASPIRPMLLRLDGWKIRPDTRQDGEWVAGRTSKLALFVPPDSGPIALQSSMRVDGEDRPVRLSEDDRTLAEWTASSTREVLFTTADLKIRPGLHHLTLSVADGSSRSRRADDFPVLKVRGLTVSNGLKPAQLASPGRSPDREATR
ncbi:hypothetical protein EP7_004129 [Isosphaeraceae bacterium EP7]